eukprot:gene15510-21600_t
MPDLSAPVLQPGAAPFVPSAPSPRVTASGPGTTKQAPERHNPSTSQSNVGGRPGSSGQGAGSSTTQPPRRPRPPKSNRSKPNDAEQTQEHMPKPVASETGQKAAAPPKRDHPQSHAHAHGPGPSTVPHPSRPPKSAQGRGKPGPKPPSAHLKPIPHEPSHADAANPGDGPAPSAQRPPAAAANAPAVAVADKGKGGKGPGPGPGPSRKQAKADRMGQQNQQVRAPPTHPSRSHAPRQDSAHPGAQPKGGAHNRAKGPGHTGQLNQGSEEPTPEALVGGGKAGSEVPDQEDEEEAFTCVVCCEHPCRRRGVRAGGGEEEALKPRPFVARQFLSSAWGVRWVSPMVCARCCLRMRMCYTDVRCPLCKTSLPEVVVLRPPASGPVPGYQTLLGSGRDRLWSKPRWAKGVNVYEPLEGPPEGKRSSRLKPLHALLQQMTAIACAVCDRGGKRPFPAQRALSEHMWDAHHKSLCQQMTAIACAVVRSRRQAALPSSASTVRAHVCFKAGRNFILELTPFTDEGLAKYTAGRNFTLELTPFTDEGLAKHTAAEHPACEFCNNQRFFGSDELYSHMTQDHFSCHVCQRGGLAHRYFRDAHHLQSHMKRDHFMCEEPDCMDCLIAFTTEEELKQHWMNRHSRSMPRWDNSRARRMVLDISSFVAPQLDGMPPSSGGGRGRQGRRGAAAAGVAAAGGEDGQGPPQGVGRGGRRGQGQQLHLRPQEMGEVHDMEGGLNVIDDDLGMTPQESMAFRGGGRGGSQRGQGPGASSNSYARASGGAWASQASGMEENFPSLSAAAGSSRSMAAAVTHSIPTLKKVVVKCPCGRRSEAFLSREDDIMPTMACNNECGVQQRKTQLAAAFGVADADNHVSYFDRHRTPTYSPALIQAAQEHPDWANAVERDIATFVADTTSKRQTLQPMSSGQRKLVHELAEQGYGLATASIGSSNRCVQMYKTAGSGVPSQRLSAIAAATTQEMLTQMEAALDADQKVLHLIDIAPSANLNQFLREWKGDYTLDQQGTTATVSFTKQSVFKSVSDILGGGVRGVFRIERKDAAKKPTSFAQAATIVHVPPPAPAPASTSAYRAPHARAGGAGSSSTATDPGSGWLVVKKGSKASAGSWTGSGAAPTSYVDPWTDEKKGGETKVQASPPLEDWEDALGLGSSEVVVPDKLRKFQLDVGNMWQALGEGEGEREEDELADELAEKLEVVDDAGEGSCGEEESSSHSPCSRGQSLEQQSCDFAFDLARCHPPWHVRFGNSFVGNSATASSVVRHSFRSGVPKQGSEACTELGGVLSRSCCICLSSWTFADWLASWQCQPVRIFLVARSRETHKFLELATDKLHPTAFQLLVVLRCVKASRCIRRLRGSPLVPLVCLPISMVSAAPFKALALLAILTILLAAAPSVDASKKKSGTAKTPKSAKTVKTPKSEATLKTPKSEDTVKTPKTLLVCDSGFGVKGSKCKECKPGEFSMGGFDVDCEDCPAGTFSLEGAESCTDCPVDTYVDKDGHGKGSCKDCKSDSSTLGQTGQTECFTPPPPPPPSPAYGGRKALQARKLRMVADAAHAVHASQPDNTFYGIDSTDYEGFRVAVSHAKATGLCAARHGRLVRIDGELTHVQVSMLLDAIEQSTCWVDAKMDDLQPDECACFDKGKIVSKPCTTNLPVVCAVEHGGR